MAEILANDATTEDAIIRHGDQAASTKQQIVEKVGQLIEYLGPRTPRSLHEFAVLLQPFNDKQAALAIWNTVQVDLRTTSPVRSPAEPQSTADQDGWVPMGKLPWPAGMEEHRKRTRFLDNHSQQIRSRRPRKNRREVFAADFVSFWSQHNKASFEGLDGADRPPLTPDGTTISPDVYLNGAAKLYGKVAADKARRPRQ
jgi:hypothetical protein